MQDPCLIKANGNHAHNESYFFLDKSILNKLFQRLTIVVMVFRVCLLALK